jgi:hypothetical protein
VELLEHAANLPFAVVADPTKVLYAEFGVESSVSALLDPRAWLPIIRGVVRSAARIAARQGRAPSLIPAGGRFGLPADFLIANDGRILAVKYGAHAYDQWSVDELLALAQPAIQTALATSASLLPGGANPSARRSCCARRCDNLPHAAASRGPIGGYRERARPSAQPR